MASEQRLAIRKASAMGRIIEALGDSVIVYHKDHAIRDVLQMEAIADAIADATKPKKPIGRQRKKDNDDD